MRKTILEPNQTPTNQPIAPESYLNVETLAQVVLNSEADGYPIESALSGNPALGWRASAPGEQSIRLVFDQALNINRIALIFEECELQRTQQFVLRWSTDNLDFQEVLRQQFNFSPPETITEIENYTVNLQQLKALELVIIPDISGKLCHASLKQLRLG